MRQISEYDIYIFDCDGVILDSNQLKIDAMERTLCTLAFDKLRINQCINYFRNNFGKSRFHHVEVFLNNYLTIEPEDNEEIKLQVLELFSKQCKELYIKADITPGFINFLKSLDGLKYIASGSEQYELRQVFEERGLDRYFVDIFGSPVSKEENIKSILGSVNNSNALMFGDAMSDFEAAQNNGIDFIAYIPFSNVKGTMSKLASKENFLLIDSWVDLQ